MKHWEEILSSFDYSTLNQDCLQICIETMQDVVDNKRAFNMEFWQDQDDALYLYDMVITEQKELHECNTAACFAGHVALNPKFQQMGGSVHCRSGSPMFNGLSGSQAINEFLEMPRSAEKLHLGEHLCIPTSNIYKDVYRQYQDITAQHVLDRLLYIQKISLEVNA